MLSWKGMALPLKTVSLIAKVGYLVDPTKAPELRLARGRGFGHAPLLAFDQ
jgi:hypothetical protein